MGYNVSPADQFKLTVGKPVYFIKWASTSAIGPLIRLVNSTQNWWDAVMVYWKIKDSAVIILKDNKKFKLDKGNFQLLLSLTEFYALPSSITKKYIRAVGKEGFVADINGFELKLPLSATSVIKEIYENRHAGFTSQGKIVIDVGAYNGDSAVYYIVKEKAKKVFAYEPVGYLVDIAKNIIKENGLQDRISIFKSAVTSGKKNYDNKGFDKSEGRINKITLEDAIKRAGSENLILKIDVEGGEYDILLDTPGEILRMFDAIFVEYHYGYMNIVERLRKEGFEVSYAKPAYSFKGLGNRPMIMGDIFAVRK